MTYVQDGSRMDLVLGCVKNLVLERTTLGFESIQHNPHPSFVRWLEDLGLVTGPFCAPCARRYMYSYKAFCACLNNRTVSMTAENT